MVSLVPVDVVYFCVTLLTQAKVNTKYNQYFCNFILIYSLM